MTKYVTGGPPRYAHQRRGLNKMIQTRGVTALLFDPGLGKSATVIDYAGLLALKSPSGEARVLVVCPLVAIDTWVIQSETFMSPQVNFWAESLGGTMLERAEALAARGGNPYPRPLKGRKRRRTPPHHPRALHHDRAVAWGFRDPSRAIPATPSEGPDGISGPRVVLEVINTDTLSRRDTVGSQTMADVMVDAIRRFNPDLVVVDESHKIKSPGGNASRLLARVAKFVPRRVILTGTVMPHSPLDVFGQWRFLDPYAFGDRQADGATRQATFGSFKNRFARLGGWMGKEVVGFKDLDDMQKIMAVNASVARKEEALDLPPTTDVTIPVDLSPAESKAYAEMRDQLATQLGNGEQASTGNRLTQMLRLRQITSGHLPDDRGNVTVIGDSKARTIRSIVHDTLAGEKRIVVFALFTAEIRVLTQVLREKGTEVVTISGGTSGQDRMAIRKRFGSDDPARIVLIAQVRTMSLAVNELITASHCIFASLSQQRDDLVQARDRLNRIGQKYPVTFWYTIAPGTVDQVILDTHNQRGDLESAMLKHVQGDDRG